MKRDISLSIAPNPRLQALGNRSMEIAGKTGGEPKTQGWESEINGALTPNTGPSPHPRFIAHREHPSFAIRKGGLTQ